MRLAMTLGFAICALGFGLLTLMLLRRRAGDAPVLLLVGACAATALWAASLAYDAWFGGVPLHLAELYEVARGGLWVYFFATLLGRAPQTPVLRGLRVMAYLLPAFPLGIVLMNAAAAPEATFAAGVDGRYIFGGLLLAVAGLVVLEQLYRNLPPERRWSMKHLCLGVGAIFAYDVYVYSEAILVHELGQATWGARGAVAALAAPLVAVSAARNRDWSLNVFVSRHVAFHAVALLVAGGYLVLVAAAGYYVRDLGGTLGEFAQLVLVAAGLVALFVVLGSGEVRARLRVLLSKHFFRNKYDYREEWLRLTRSLTDESAGDMPYERAIRAVAQIFASPGGAVWVRGEPGELRLAGTWRLASSPRSVLPVSDSLLELMRRSRWVVDVDEYRAGPGRYGDVPMPGWLEEVDRPWVLFPLLQEDDLLGVMLLTRPNVTAEITWEDRDLLKTLGVQLAMFLGQHENAQALSQSRQFEAFHRLTAFLMHDLKNLIAQQSLVVRNAERHKRNPEFVDDAMATIGNSVRRMERLLEHLQTARSYGEVQRMPVRALLESAIDRCGDRRPEPRLAVEDDAAEMTARVPEDMATVLAHLVRNAQDATGEDGTVDVRARVAGDELVLEIEDDGAGMDESFIRDSLFRPFHSTKSSRGMGIGAYQARELVRAAGGRVEVSSEKGKGTVFRAVLPADSAREGMEARRAVEAGYQA